jgi:RimJ/RimL family protein N-acetyltransferase
VALKSAPERHTERLILRRWRPDDLAPFAALNSDPETMRYFPNLLTKEQSDQFVARIEAAFEEAGWGLWAVEVPGVTPFIGFVGLWPATIDAPFTPATEVGWRLARPWWGRGFATEAARAALDFGFHDLGLGEIVSFTSRLNVPSQRVMQRVGMSRDAADDFEHPSIPPGDPLRPHVLYRLARPDFLDPP